MKDIRLVQLNFREIVDYSGQPQVQYSYSSPLPCAGYCISCEQADLPAQTGGRLDLMSHGCDSADFVTVLGPMPPQGTDAARAIEEPVLFLLEDPGEDWGIGEVVPYQGLQKRPPLYHYYWTPKVQTWPRRVADFNRNFYGPYFAYLMWRHQLLNVYITNLVKCKWVKNTDNQGGSGKSIIVTHCVERYLTREVQIFAPRLVFCFGRAAEKGARALAGRAVLHCPLVYLLHPSYIQNRWGTSGRSQEELIQDNDAAVKRGITQLAEQRPAADCQ
jgi:hypothetical protein